MKICKTINCDRAAWAKEKCIKHYKQDWRHPLYITWDSMKQRCGNPNNVKYHLYGKRGIKVCDRWLNFNNFIADMGEKPTPKHTVDRINNDGDYEPSNCRWATGREQNFNQKIRSDNTSGVKGVSWDKSKNKWVVRFWTGGKYVHFGHFNNLEEATEKRKEVFEEYHDV